MGMPLIRQNGLTDKEKTERLAVVGVNVKGEPPSVIASQFNRIFG